MINAIESPFEDVLTVKANDEDRIAHDTWHTGLEQQQR